MIPLSERELTVFELRCSGLRAGLVAQRLGLQRTLVGNADRIARRKLLAMYKERLMPEIPWTQKDPYKMTEEEYDNAESQQSDRYVDGELVKGEKEKEMDRKHEKMMADRKPENRAIAKAACRALDRIKQVDIVASEKPPDGATHGELRAWKLRMIGLKFAHTMALLETMNVVGPDDMLDACVDELYDDATVFGGATTGDIDDTLGAGIGNMAHQEASMADNIFGGGGATAGGIFGPEPVATSFHDPGESVRSAQLRKANAEAQLAEVRLMAEEKVGGARARALEAAAKPRELEGSDPKQLGKG